MAHQKLTEVGFLYYKNGQQTRQYKRRFAKDDYPDVYQVVDFGQFKFQINVFENQKENLADVTVFTEEDQSKSQSERCFTHYRIHPEAEALEMPSRTLDASSPNLRVFDGFQLEHIDYPTRCVRVVIASSTMWPQKLGEMGRRACQFLEKHITQLAYRKYLQNGTFGIVLRVALKSQQPTPEYAIKIVTKMHLTEKSGENSTVRPLRTSQWKREVDIGKAFKNPKTTTTCFPHSGCSPTFTKAVSPT